jgi:hypothetical protein
MQVFPQQKNPMHFTEETWRRTKRTFGSLWFGNTQRLWFRPCRVVEMLEKRELRLILWRIWRFYLMKFH